MARSNKIVAYALVAATSLAAPATAQVAGRKLGACPERVFLSRDQIAVATAMSTVLDELDNLFYGVRGDANIFVSMKECARTLPYHACTDDLLLGVIDPVGAAAGGAAGLAVDMYKGEPSVLGGLLGSGVVGTTWGIVKAASCKKRFASLQSAAVEALAACRTCNPLISLSAGFLKRWVMAIHRQNTPKCG
ncbi:hypothetical protein U5801_06505 [Lamprobacter modestohalophilus]|uniref:hypothetical protein n=1 Tax=Lamprobacter modestohalophilus TaxID=1064514 RepID=UPI002ADECEF1|nr:hypothetical protein [Lamprobacter modestohalophilus]MEA1049454.1 hypothetical protein [Lamprobacter modestohalophilus]